MKRPLKLYKSLALRESIMIDDDESILIKRPHRTNQLTDFFEELIEKLMNNQEIDEHYLAIVKEVNNDIEGKSDKKWVPKTLQELKIIMNKIIPIFGNNGNYNWIDTCNITSLTCLFKNQPDFNGDITRWDVSNVTNINQAFMGCKSFTQNLKNWDMSNVISATGGFNGCVNYPYKDEIKAKLKNAKFKMSLF